MTVVCLYIQLFSIFINSLLIKALAEILSIKSSPNGETYYYIHYIDYNKRLDEWVTKERLDLQNLVLPEKTNKTPLKNGSRPSSPDREIVVENVF